MDLVCTCKKHNSTAGDIECNYGTYKNCKFVVGKPFHCILNPEGQLRRKRDLRHLETMLTNSQIENKPVRTTFILKQNIDIYKSSKLKIFFFIIIHFVCLILTFLIIQHPKYIII